MTTTTTQTPAQQIQHALRYFFEADRALDGARANLRRGVTLKDVDAIQAYRDDAAGRLRAAGREIGDDDGDVEPFDGGVFPPRPMPERATPLQRPGASQYPQLWHGYAHRQFGSQGGVA